MNVTTIVIIAALTINFAILINTYKNNSLMKDAIFYGESLVLDICLAITLQRISWIIIAFIWVMASIRLIFKIRSKITDLTKNNIEDMISYYSDRISTNKSQIKNLTANMIATNDTSSLETIKDINNVLASNKNILDTLEVKKDFYKYLSTKDALKIITSPNFCS